jgi:outer membrane biosynthesis protein TonB
VILRPRSVLRSAALALALLAAAVATALGTPQQVLEDYNLDGRIDASYSVHDLRAALVLPAPTSQYGGFADAVQGRLTEELTGSQPDAPAGPQYGAPQYGATPPPARPTPTRAAPRTPAPAPAAPPVLPSPVPRPDTRASPPAPPVAAPRRQRLVNRVQDLGSEVLAPAVVVPPRLATFPTPPAPSPQQRLPGGFVPLAALAAALVAAGVLSGLWRSLRSGGGRRAARRRIETLRPGE